MTKYQKLWYSLAADISGYRKIEQILWRKEPDSEESVFATTQDLTTWFSLIATNRKKNINNLQFVTETNLW